MIRLYFTGKNNPLGRLIGAGTGGFEYHHVGAVVSIAPFTEGDLVSAHWQDGVQVRKDADEGGWTHWAYVDIPCTDEQAQKAAQWLKSQVGKRYGMGAIFEMVWRVLTSCGAPSYWPSRWICSGVMTQMLVKVGLYPAVKPIPIRLYTPRDIFVLSLAIPGARWIARTRP